MDDLRYLAGYPPAPIDEVRPLLAAGQLGAVLAQRHPQGHTVRSDAALQACVAALKARHLRSSPPLAKVAFDNRLWLTAREPES